MLNYKRTPPTYYYLEFSVWATFIETHPYRPFIYPQPPPPPHVQESWMLQSDFQDKVGKVT